MLPLLISFLTAFTNAPTSSTTSITNSSSKKVDDTFYILNSKWTFTDALNETYIIDIKGLSRDEKSAKANIIKNGNILGPILVQKESFLCLDGIPTLEFKNADNIRITFPYDLKRGHSTCMEFVKWDYKEGYLYTDSDALKSEDPQRRISIRLIAQTPPDKK